MRPRWRDFPNVSAGGVAATFHQVQESHGAALILSSAKRPEGRRWIPPSGDLLGWFEMLANRPDDQRLDVGCRHAAHRSGALGGAMEKGAGQVVSVLAAALADMARAHAVAAVIKDAAGQQGVGVHPCGPMIGRLLTQLGLDGVEKVPMQNAGLFAIEDLTLECHLTDIEAIAKEMGERPAGERNAADGLSGLQRANLGDDALFAQL